MECDRIKTGMTLLGLLEIAVLPPMPSAAGNIPVALPLSSPDASAQMN